MPEYTPKYYGIHPKSLVCLAIFQHKDTSPILPNICTIISTEENFPFVYILITGHIVFFFQITSFLAVMT